MQFRPLPIAALLLALAAPSAQAAPAFPKRYVGTVEGSLKTGSHLDRWKVTGLTYRRTSLRYARGRWGGTYKLTGGKVAWTSTGRGECRYSAKGSVKLSPRKNALTFLQNLSDPGYSYGVRAFKRRKIEVTKNCATGGDAYTLDDEVDVAGGQWLTAQEGIGFSTRGFKGRHTERSFEGDAFRWKWRLRRSG